MFNNTPGYVSPYSSYNSYYTNPALLSSIGQIQNYNNTIPQQGTNTPNTTNTNNNNNNYFSGSIVSNYDEVRNFPIPATGSVMLLDVVNKRFYIKGMGSDGIPQIQAYFYDSVLMDRELKQGTIQNTQVEQIETNALKDYITKINEIDERLGILEKQSQTIEKKAIKKEV